jgi:muramoyltetrapeptide carboxypeptidase
MFAQKLTDKQNESEFIGSDFGKPHEIRIVSLAQSLSVVSKKRILKAKQSLEKTGYKVTFAKYAFSISKFNITSIEKKIEDLHAAFLDDSVAIIMAGLGGFDSNKILDFLDYGLIAKHPKILCGYSDITAVLNAIYAKTSLVTYYGPVFGSFYSNRFLSYTLDYVKKAFFFNEPYELKPAEYWQKDNPYGFFSSLSHRNRGLNVIQKGIAKGTIIGGNLCTFNLLQGTQYLPDPDDDIILFLEEDNIVGNLFPMEFERKIQSITQQNYFNKVKGILFGRFEIPRFMQPHLLKSIILSIKKLRNIPIIMNVDFGHVLPKCVFPIGGKAEIDANENAKIKIIEH